MIIMKTTDVDVPLRLPLTEKYIAQRHSEWSVSARNACLRGRAVGCGVCDTPELWRGAAGLRARLRACAGATASLHCYIHTYIQRE